MASSSQTGENLGPYLALDHRQPASGWYGQLGVDGTKVQAHRFAYELLVGPIPDGLEIDHLCRVTACVNPAHLEPVTGQVNTLRGDTPAAKNAAKTHCPQGHVYSVKNTGVGNGRRRCRTCGRERTRAARARKRTRISMS